MPARRSLVAFLASAAALTVSSLASADEATRRAGEGYTEETRLDGDSVVKFSDDVMKAGDAAPLGDIVKPPPIATRAQLVRPRFNFVPELLKTVENL